MLLAFLLRPDFVMVTSDNRLLEHNPNHKLHLFRKDLCNAEIISFLSLLRNLRNLEKKMLLNPVKVCDEI